MAPTTLAILQSAVLPWEQQSHPRQPGLWTETDRERGRVTARGERFGRNQCLLTALRAAIY